MVIQICIGSACHLKGARPVIQKMNELVKKNGLEDTIKLEGSFCMGQCSDKVKIKVDEEIYEVLPEEVENFFNTTVLERARA